jgi:nucleotide-binding universal stress UspA family protein
VTPADAQPPVVVGIGGGASAGDAVDWAAAEAATRECPLRIVHALQPALPADLYGIGSPADDLLPVRAAAESLLAESVARARRVASDIEVSAGVVSGPAVAALLGETEGARLLVLGSGSPRGLRGLLSRSMIVQVAGHASCPVAVIPPAAAENRRASTPPRVVVGVDDDTSCTHAVGFAFRAARQRGVPLVAVHAVAPDPPADLDAARGSSPTAAALGRQALDRVLHRWHPLFPDVPVVTRLVDGDPARALVAESRGASLVVVGSRGRGVVSATVFGSVSRSVLRHGTRPLAVVRQLGVLPSAPTDLGRHPAAERDRAADGRAPGRRGRPSRRRPA